MIRGVKYFRQQADDYIRNACLTAFQAARYDLGISYDMKSCSYIISRMPS